jgi:hypothetical protein
VGQPWGNSRESCEAGEGGPSAPTPIWDGRSDARAKLGKPCSRRAVVAPERSGRLSESVPEGGSSPSGGSSGFRRWQPLTPLASTSGKVTFSRAGANSVCGRMEATIP